MIVISNEEVVSQHCIVVSDVKIKPCKEEKQPFIPKRKIWKLNKCDVKVKTANDFRNVTQRVNVEDHVEDLWKILKDNLLNAADNSCGWTKGLPRHKVTWWWNNDVDQAVKKKRQLWIEWEQGSSKEPYLQAKRDSKRAVYAAKKFAEEERFSSIIEKEDSRKEKFEIAKQIKVENCDVVGDSRIKNDKGELAFTDAKKHLAWKEHYEKLLNEEFP